jgi:hypothetical protein
VLSAALGLVLLAGCTGTSDAGADGGSEFENKLEFGETSVGFDLVGKGSTFSVATMPSAGIAFRLESAADFDGRFVRLYIYSESGSQSAPYWQRDYVPGQTYGHILLSTFRITDTGSYEVRGYLVTSGGSETHVATSPITMTQ